MTSALSVRIDVAEPRVSRDPIVALCDGKHWDLGKSTCFIDGITRTAMLAPLRYTAAWDTTTTGLYYRLHKTDYTFVTMPFVAVGTPPPYPAGTATDQSKWVEHHSPYQGNVYLQSQGVNDTAVTNARYHKNQPFHLSWFSYNPGQQSIVQMECGWLSEKAFIALRIWTDGKTEIYKNGTFVGEGNIFERHVTSQTVYGKERDSYRQPKAAKGDSRQLAQQIIELTMIPCRRRDLLLLSNQGGGFRFTFEDLDPDDPDNTITPGNAQFIWRVPQGQVSVLCAPVNFATSGDLYSIISAPRQPLTADDVATYTAYFDEPGYGDSLDYFVELVDPNDLATPFAPDGVKNQFRLHVSLSGAGNGSLWLYGASAVYDAIIENTDGSNVVDIVPYIVSADLSVPESPSDVLMKTTCRSPDELGTGLAFPETVSNRPCQISIDGFTILTGRMKPVGGRDGPDDRSSRIMQEYRDFCKAQEEYRITNAVPVDGFEFAKGFKYFAQLPGFSDSMMDVPDLGFNLPTIGQTSEGEFALLPKEGDKALEWMKKLWEMFAQHTQWGWIPTILGPILQMRSIDFLEADAPQLTLYARIEDAVNAGFSRSEAVHYVYRTLEPSSIECEANDIQVRGRDPRTGKVFMVRYVDKDSVNPTLPAAQRPANWLGESRIYELINSAITSRPAATWSAATIARRVTPARRIYPFECDMLFRDDGAPVWRGHKVTLDGIGDVKINTFTTNFELMDDVKFWAPSHYTGEFIG